VSELQSWIDSDLKKLDKQCKVRELTELENWIIDELEKLEKQNTRLYQDAKKSNLRIKALEEKVEELMIILLQVE
tara:strand:- start:284 stop:508 length:225 start_codon:yes stop_codon:yes gene_type:complete